MRTLVDFKVIPRTLRSDTKETVSIIPKDPSRRFDDSATYNLRITPMDNYTDRADETGFEDLFKVQPQNGVISFECTLWGEQEWQITLWKEDIKNAWIFHVYSLFEDMYERFPLRGDLHSHSCRSDGTHTPATVAANYRKHGFDFLALTDHSNWHGSDEMIRFYENIPLGMELMHGEEIHIKMPKDTPTYGSGNIHLVGLGTCGSVTDLYNSDPEKYNKEILDGAKELDLPGGVDAVQFSHRKWIADKIHELGGMAVIPHAFWLCGPGNYRDEDTTHRKFRFYHIPENMLDALIEREVFDAYEILSGGAADKENHENNVQTAFYYDQRAKGRNIPVIGSSDSHRTEPPVLFGEVETVVLAKENKEKEILCAIKDGYSVAIEKVPGELPRVHGTYRMVKYVRFLLWYYFPEHDELCFEEGRLMRELACGDFSAKDALVPLADRTRKHAERVLRNR